jgi:hypothetical protein
MKLEYENGSKDLFNDSKGDFIEVQEIEEEEEEVIKNESDSDQEYVDVNEEDNEKTNEKILQEGGILFFLKIEEARQINHLKGLLSQTANEFTSPLTVRNRSFSDAQKFETLKKHEEKDWFEKMLNSDEMGGGYESLKKE